ncbi:MAG: glycosyltransferase [Candidatus Omnitrophota bacterium]
MSKFNVIIITNLYPNPQEPLRGNFVESVMQNLRTQCDIVVVSPLPWFPRASILKRFKNWYKFSQVPFRFTKDGIPVISPKFLALPKMGILHPVFLFIALLPVLMRLKRAQKIDLINAHWLFPDGVAAVWVARFLRLPIVLSAHGCDINLYLKTFFRRVQISGAIKHCRALTVVSNAQKSIIEELELGYVKMEVVQNGVDQEKFSLKEKVVCRKKLNLKSDGKIILFIGQLIEVKGVMYLLEAIKRIKENRQSNVTLYVVGDGDLRHEVETFVESSGLQEQVKLCGKRNYDEIPDWIGASDCLCLASIREGFPCVVVEALSCGRPVVASKVGGIPDLISGKNGFVCQPRDVEMLALALCRALEMTWDEKQIRDSVASLTWSKVADKYFRVFQDVVLLKEKGL